VLLYVQCSYSGVLLQRSAAVADEDADSFSSDTESVQKSDRQLRSRDSIFSKAVSREQTAKTRHRRRCSSNAHSDDNNNSYNAEDFDYEPTETSNRPKRRKCSTRRRVKN